WLPYHGTEKATQFGRIDREFNTSDPQYDYYKRDQILLSGEISHDFGGVTVTNVSRFGWAQVEESAPYAYGWGSGAAWTPAFDNHFQMTPVNGQDTLSRIFFEHETQTLTALNDLRAETTATTGPLRHELLFGADFKWFALDQVQASVSSPDAPVVSTRTPQYGGLGPISPVPYIDNEIEQTGFGLYVQDRIRFGDGWLATLNGRHDWVTTEASGTPAYDQSDAEFSWRVGLAKTLGFGLTPYVSAATFFNPLVGTAANGPLHPETGRQIEAGLKYEPAFMDALFTASVFRIEREGVVTGPFNAQTQIGEATSQGLELEGRGRILPNLTFAAAATFMDVDVNEDANAALIGKTPVATIQQQVAARLSWETPWIEGLTLTGGVRWQGDSWADDANTLKVSGRTLFDVAIAYRLTPDAQLKLSVTNLTDETYVASCDGALSCYYGEGRRVSLNLTQAF
ncbi:MAG: TonB-dependent receptor, partial [Pseudomonadota bacterium]|nr:TonB-dependent receptor [Pseudomonadota bacterium]